MILRKINIHICFSSQGLSYILIGDTGLDEKTCKEIQNGVSDCDVGVTSLSDEDNENSGDGSSTCSNAQ